MPTDPTSKPYRRIVYGALWFDTPDWYSLHCMQSATSKAAHLAQHHNSSLAINLYGIAFLASGSAFAHRTMGINISMPNHILSGILACDREAS